LASLTAHLAHEIFDTVFDCSPFSPTLELGKNIHGKDKREQRGEQNEKR
jgi:hypothetical protein